MNRLEGFFVYVLLTGLRKITIGFPEEVHYFRGNEHGDHEHVGRVPNSVVKGDDVNSDRRVHNESNEAHPELLLVIASVVLREVVK